MKSQVFFVVGIFFSIVNFVVSPWHAADAKEMRNLKAPALLCFASCDMSKLHNSSSYCLPFFLILGKIHPCAKSIFITPGSPNFQF